MRVVAGAEASGGRKPVKSCPCSMYRIWGIILAAKSLLPAPKVATMAAWGKSVPIRHFSPPPLPPTEEEEEETEHIYQHQERRVARREEERGRERAAIYPEGGREKKREIQKSSHFFAFAANISGLPLSREAPSAIVFKTRGIFVQSDNPFWSCVAKFRA